MDRSMNFSGHGLCAVYDKIGKVKQSSECEPLPSSVKKNDWERLINLSMIVSTHQPIFLPWPGFFFKSMKSDCMVLLDDVQYPRGRGWMNRNRLKCAGGELWLTVPVYRKNRGLQRIQDVTICNDTRWVMKHLRAIQQSYAHAPYIDSIFQAVEKVYSKAHTKILSLNLDLIHALHDALDLKNHIRLQSKIGANGNGTDLIVDVCKRLGADTYLAFRPAEKYLDAQKLKRGGVRVVYEPFYPPVYPQLWGDFLYNLSALDLALSCGPKSAQIIESCAQCR